MFPITTIVKARYFASAASRIIGAIVLLAGLPNWRSADSMFQNVYPGYSAIGSAIRSYWGPILEFVAGLVLIVFARRIATWLFPVPDQTCPKCSYAITPDQQRCPECGLALNAAASVVKARYIVRAVFRPIAIILVLGSLRYVPAVSDDYQSIVSVPPGKTVVGQLARVYAEPLLALAVGLLLLTFARRIATWVFPIPDQSCPKCSCVNTPDQQRCTKCGLALVTPAATPAPASPKTTPPAA